MTVENRQLVRHYAEKLSNLRSQCMEAMCGLGWPAKMIANKSDALYNCYLGGTVTIEELVEEIAIAERELATYNV